ncbi:hypothetical protein [Hydrogenophaga sp.]|uniref:hypothetical protein n=1 Tax=Hydrogenophaga sp. TaxID=1904254 RepID=UPI00272128B3|nr:hypothetical protein [Hydrogenophaga sp.]MDO9437886.1 hypothetical protein [Hydrogenophaga sp.]
MKARFFYQWNHHEPVYGHAPYLLAHAVLVEPGRFDKDGFNIYLLSALMSDFSANRFGDLDTALEEVEKVQTNQSDHFETGGQDFVHHITRSRVRFEHSVFGECPEWPIWCCTLSQYKAALQGYRSFLDMPKSIDSELTVELPDGKPEHCR